MNLRNIMLVALCVFVGVHFVSGNSAETLNSTNTNEISENLFNPDLNVSMAAIKQLCELKDTQAIVKVIQALERNIPVRDGSERATSHAIFVIELVKLLNVLTGSNYQLDIYNDDERLRHAIVESSIEKLGSQVLDARVILKPEALEVSPGILTAFVRLPDGYPVSGIISATCDGAPSERMPALHRPGMPNEDGTEMIIKFRRKDIEETLAQWGGSLDIHFVVRGTWQGAAETRLFQGTDSITKIVGAKEKKK